MSTSIPISGLNSLNQISSSDYVAIVQDTTTTTFRASLDVVSAWISSSVQASSSLVSISSSTTISSSWSDNSGNSISSSFLIYPNNSTASYSISASIAASASWAPIQGSTAYSLSASWASSSIWSTSSSFASQSVSASWAPIQVSASWASSSLVSISSSFASASISSSYALTASYVPTSSINAINFVKAFGTFYVSGSLNTTNGQANWLPFSGSFNFISASYRGNVNQNQGFGGMLSSSLGKLPAQNNYGNFHTWIFYMSTPMPTTNYTVITSIGGEQGSEHLSLGQFPYAARTTTAFSMSWVEGGANWDDRNQESDWVSIMVLHP